MSARRPVSDATLRGWVKECRQLFPTDKPVRVRRVRAARRDWAGFCRDVGDYIEIKIDERLDRREALGQAALHPLRHELVRHTAVKSSSLAALDAACKELRSGTSETLSSRATASIHQKPALWRVSSYSGPGLPRPTKSLIMVRDYPRLEWRVA